MYDVNAGVPKTIDPVSSFAGSPTIASAHLVEGRSEALRKVLFDIFDTHRSHRSFTARRGRKIAQLTEAQLGPYELRLLLVPFHAPRAQAYVLDRGPGRRSLWRRRHGRADRRWLKLFFQRFFRNQFKRSCTPRRAEGRRSGALSARRRWRMPSDAHRSMRGSAELDEGRTRRSTRLSKQRGRLGTGRSRPVVSCGVSHVGFRSPTFLGPAAGLKTSAAAAPR